jgi:prevent-host-death family protein
MRPVEGLHQDIYMVKNIVMLKVNVFEVKAKLSEYLDRAAGGERIVICRHNKPVAELRPVTEVRTEPRPVGPLPGRPRFDVPPSFFTAMPADELDRWEGIAPSDPLGSVARVQKPRVPKVAERRASYRPSSGRARRRRS